MEIERSLRQADAPTVPPIADNRDKRPKAMAGSRFVWVCTSGESIQHRDIEGLAKRRVFDLADLICKGPYLSFECGKRLVQVWGHARFYEVPGLRVDVTVTAQLQKSQSSAHPSNRQQSKPIHMSETPNRRTGEAPKWRTSGFVPGHIGASRQPVEMVSGFGKIKEWGEASTASLIAP